MNFEFNDILSALGNIRGGIPALHLSKRARLGEHRSVFFGPSYNFHDIQEYDPERDPPNQKIPHIIGPDEDIIYSRRCIEDHEIKVNFLVDLSASIYTGNNFKRRMLLEAMGFIGMTGIRYQDSVGMIGFNDKIVLNMSPKNGLNNLCHLLKITYDYIESHEPRSKKVERKQTDYYVALDFIRRSFRRSCYIPMISDFVGFDKLISSSLLRTVASRHELVFVFLDDHLEYASCEGLGYLRIRDIETGRAMIISRKKMAEVQREIRQDRKDLRRQLRRLGIDSVVLEYPKHFKRLQKFFLKRQKFPRTT